MKKAAVNIFICSSLNISECGDSCFCDGEEAVRLVKHGGNDQEMIDNADAIKIS